MSAAEQLLARVEQTLRRLGMPESEILELRRRATMLAGEMLSRGEIRIDDCPACGAGVDQLTDAGRARSGRTLHLTPCGHAVLVTISPLEGGRPGRHVKLTRP